jgi:hypothetical protein
LNNELAMPMAWLPDNLITAMAPVPGAVAIAQMVPSFLKMVEMLPSVFSILLFLRELFG